VRVLDAFGPRSWARPEVVSFGRLPMHSDLGRETRERLDGDWSFRLLPRPEDVRPADLTGPTGGWATVAVPGCWTMQGFDRPQYTNVVMPFPGPPPEVPAGNPTGVYRRTVGLPRQWQDRRIRLHVGGAESVLYAYVDGRPVGMGKDSRLPQEFDLTGLVEPDRPFELALCVVRWSDATYLEDQDHWFHAGVHRGVFVEAVPAVHVEDVKVEADYDPATATGGLRVRVKVGAPGFGPRGWTARVEIDGLVAEAPVRFEHPTNALVNVAAFAGRGADLALAVPAVRPWSAETPELYDLTVTLADAGGHDRDSVSLRIGFRRVEVVGPHLRVNGRPVLVKGVNRHDHDPAGGKAVTAETTEADVVAMKQHNLNAVRTSHYPADTALYEACDRLGLYVLDEANVESHAYLHSLSKDPVFTPAILERVTRMAERDKNHPSVVMWSLGNESGVSPAHHAAAAWLRAWDPSRPLHYESGISEDELGALSAGEAPDLADLLARPRPESDVIAPMYPPVKALVTWATRSAPDRPLVMCEYCHAMGNSCGGLADYWQAIRDHVGLGGGFVWDWADQALWQAMPDGSRRLAYGGDFGDEPNDGAFCLNGLVAADRTPHPSLLEEAKVLQSVHVRLSGRQLLVTNEFAFLDLSFLEPSYEVAVNGVPVATGSLPPLELAPGATAVLALPLPGLHLRPGERACLDLAWRTREAQAWAPAGHLLAWEQLELARSPGPTPAPSSPGEGAGVAGLAELEPRLALWRAPVDNERFGPRHAERWARLGLRHPEAIAELGTEVSRSGSSLRVEHTVVVPDHLDDLPRVGVRLRPGPGVRSVEWLGIGPHECYSDRRASGRFGRYVTAVDDWPVPYVHPQASGNRTGVRWLRLLDAKGRTILTIDELDDLDVTVSRWTDEEVDEAAHLEDLPVRDDCYVWIDAAHRGVGSGACGPDTAPAHRVGAGTYRWGYRLS